MHNVREQGKVTNYYSKNTLVDHSRSRREMFNTFPPVEMRKNEAQCWAVPYLKQGKAVLDQMTCHVTPKKRMFGVHGIMQMTVEPVISVLPATSRNWTTLPSGITVSFVFQDFYYEKSIQGWTQRPDKITIAAIQSRRTFPIIIWSETPNTTSVLRRPHLPLNTARTSPIPNFKNVERPRATLHPSLNQQKSFVIRRFRRLCRPHGQLVAQTGDGCGKVSKINQRLEDNLYVLTITVSVWILPCLSRSLPRS